MGQIISKEEIKTEIEKQLNVCFLSLDQEDLYSNNSISFNLSTVSSQKGSLDNYFSKTCIGNITSIGGNGSSNGNSGCNSLVSSNGFTNISSSNIDEQIIKNRSTSILLNINKISNSSGSGSRCGSPINITPSPSSLSPSPSSNDIPSSTTDQQQPTSPTTTLSKRINKSKSSSIELLPSYDGDEIYVQVLKKQSTYSQQQRPRLYERSLNTHHYNQHYNQFRPQPNEYLSLWEYFDEINSPPMFYLDQNNLTFSDYYIVQEKFASLDINNIINKSSSSSSSSPQTFTINKEFIKSVLHSFSTYISPLPNSIHFTDSNIPHSIDYNSPNILKIHPNILPIIEIIYNEDEEQHDGSGNEAESKEQQDNSSIFIIYKKYNYTLDGLLRYSLKYLQRNQKIRNFIIYQLIQLLSFLHSREVVHGDLTPSSIHLNNQMWIGLGGFSFPSTPLYHSPSENIVHSTMTQWVNGELSNFNYLMILNKLVHRHIGDPMNHPIIPWVIDFTKLPQLNSVGDYHGNSGTSTIGWRDLTKTKYRLNKGDEQLDFQFLNGGSTGNRQAHHISDMLSELTYYSYLARRTPVPLLRRFVRTNYEPNEYPGTMERLYRWTPDECIPEFFMDSTLFKSIHSDMPDLQIPEWASSNEDFITIHMNALESDQVSRQLHHWIDLTFGYLLTGEDAIIAKNLALIDNSIPRNSGIVQLFNNPHPKKKHFKNNNNNSNHQMFNNNNSFDSEFFIKFNENSFKYDSMNNSISSQHQHHSHNHSHSFLPNSILSNLTNVNSGNSGNNNNTTSRSDSFGSNSSSNSNVLLSPTLNSSNVNNNNSGSGINQSPNLLNSQNNNASQNTPYQPRSSSLLSGNSKPRASSGKKEGDTINNTSTSTTTTTNSTVSSSSTTTLSSSTTTTTNIKPTFAKFLPSLFSQSIKIEREDNSSNNNNNNSTIPPSPTNIPIQIDLLSNVNSNYIGNQNSSTLGNSSIQQQLYLQQQQQAQIQHQQQQAINNNNNINNNNSPNTTSSIGGSKLNLIHSKSEESMIKKYSNGLFSSMGISKSTNTTSTNSSSSLDVSSITSPPSPSSKDQQQSNINTSNGDTTPPRPVTPPSSDLSYQQQQHIIEPLPAELEFELLEYELNNSPNNQYQQQYLHQHQYNHNSYQQSNIFVESLYNCESTNEFNLNFERLHPIYRPMEFKPTSSSSTSQQSDKINNGLILIDKKEQNEISNIELLKSNDMFSLGCIIAELYQGYPLFTSKSLVEHFNSATLEGSSGKGYIVTSNLPINVKEFVDRLIKVNPIERIQPNELLASPLFPSYFKQMYHFLSHLHSLHTPEERLTFTLANIGIVTSLPNESIDLILPFILELFNNPKTMVSALIDLLDPLSQRLGMHLSNSYLLPCLINLYQRHDDHLLQCHLIQIPMIDMIVSRFGRDVYIHHILPFLLDSVKTNPRDNPNHEMLTTALIKISRVLGIPLTIRHMMYPLLVAFTKPRLSHLNEPLVAIASSLGENVIVKFYFPSIFILIQKHSSKASRSESIPCTLLSLLQELILLVKPGLVLRSLLKESTQLASLLLNPSNSSLLLPLAETLLRISGRIGVDNTKNFILKYVQQFFSNYSELYNYNTDNSFSRIGADSETNKQLRSIYSPEMTYYLYYKLARIIGFDVMRAEISDNSLIEHIMRVYIKDNNIKPQTNDGSGSASGSGGGIVSSASGNHHFVVPPYVSEDGLYDIVEETLDQKISSTYLLDDYQDYDDLICDQTFSLQGNIVAQYKEHTASIKSLAISPSEDRFISGSKDNLVKIWSLDSTKSLSTYNQHLHTAHSVHFVQSLVASCDITSIQVWDPESKIKVNVFYEPTGSFSCFEPIATKYLVAATSESTLSFFDLSLGFQTHEWSLAYQTGQSIRCITTSNDHHFINNGSSNSSSGDGKTSGGSGDDDEFNFDGNLLNIVNQYSSAASSSTVPSAYPTWIAAGSSSGIITVLDTRTGTILEQWKSHHDGTGSGSGNGPVTKLIGQGSRYLISCGEKSVIQWDLHSSPPTISKMWKGFKDNITSASLYNNDLIVSSGHKLSSMTLLDDPYSTSIGNTFRADGLKLNTPKQSNISSLSFLPLHHILLTGTEDGFIKICQ